MEKEKEEIFVSKWDDDKGITCFYGMHRDDKDSVNPKVEWAAPINDHLYSPHYKLLGREGEPAHS